MEKSTSIGAISKALVLFHVKVNKITKDAKNPFFKSSYASLSNILDAINEPLIESGLAFAQFPNGTHGLTTILMHSETGEYLQATYEMTPAKNDPQGLGSAITYQRRYALAAVLGLNIDEDDDGNAASGKTQSKAQVETSGKELKNAIDGLAGVTDLAKYAAGFPDWIKNHKDFRAAATKRKSELPSK